VAKLHLAVRAHLRTLEELSGRLLATVSTGLERDYTMTLQESFA